MKKVEMALIGAAAIVFLIIVMLVGAIAVVGYLYLKSNPNVGDYQYSTYNESVEATLNATITPTATPPATPTATPAANATATPTPTPTPTATPLPSDCATYEGKSEHGDRVCGGKDADASKKYVWECDDGTWTYVQTCTSASACVDGVCT